MKRILTYSICLTILFSLGFSSIKSENNNCCVEKEKKTTDLFYRIENLNVKSFFKLITDNYRETRKLNIVTLAGEFPENWVKSEDIDYLFSIIHSNAKCCGYMNSYSSHMPTGQSEVGGYAIIFLNSYINKTKINLGLDCSPKTNKKSIEKIEDWYYNEYKKEPNR